MIDVGVLVIGAGPVGLVAALELSHHGVPVLLAERGLTPTEFPKMDITNARTMELLARLDLDEPLRRAGVEPQHRFDVVFATGLGDQATEVARWSLPSVEEARQIIFLVNDGSMPSQPAQRCAQSLFERLVRDRCAEDPLVDLREGWACTGVTPDARGGATATFRDVRTGTLEHVRARWVLGCDGAGSVVRRSLGIPLEGAEGVVALALVHFRSTDTRHLQRFGRFWHVYLATGGVVIAQDEIDTYTAHLPVASDFAWDGRDPVTELRAVLGGPVEVDEVLLTSLWRPNLLVAQRYREGSVLLVGDAAHQFIPTGGYGMNTGVADAVDAGWKVAAIEQGWGGDALIESYEAERRPVALRNRDRSARHAGVIVTWPGVLCESGPSAARAFLLQERGENESFGIELDARYEDSPIVVPDGSSAPPWDPMVVHPAARPGHRLPAIVLSDGRQVLDLLGPGHTVLLVGASGAGVGQVDPTPLVRAAAAVRMPLRVVTVDDEHALEVYERRLVLVRPDGYVAWRGDDVPDDIAALVDVVTGTGRP